MESWFLADRMTLESFYGKGFNARALPQNQRVEEICKADVLDGLARATINSRKGSYKGNKGAHSFVILGMVDPSVVGSLAPSAKNLLDVLSGGGPSR